MIKLYRFLYYSLYKFCMKLGRKDIPERKAVVILCLWEGFYFLLLYAGIRYFLNNNFYIPKVLIVSFFFGVCLIHYFSLISNNLYLKIYREFEKDIGYRKKNKLITPLVFILFPFIVLLIFTFTIWR